MSWSARAARARAHRALGRAAVTEAAGAATTTTSRFAPSFSSFVYGGSAFGRSAVELACASTRARRAAPRSALGVIGIRDAGVGLAGWGVQGRVMSHVTQQIRRVFAFCLLRRCGGPVWCLESFRLEPLVSCR